MQVKGTDIDRMGYFTYVSEQTPEFNKGAGYADMWPKKTQGRAGGMT